MPFAGSDRIRIYLETTLDSGQKCRVRQLEPARGASKPRPRSDVETVGKLGRVKYQKRTEVDVLDWGHHFKLLQHLIIFKHLYFSLRSEVLFVRDEKLSYHLVIFK